jgi:NAD(P)-dependent dehydrogenase (short-subunit alcohol dehydrogenase family)
LGIRVNLIAPGVATPMVMGANINPETEKHMKETMGPDKVAPVAAWLVHEQCDSAGMTYCAAGGRAALLELGQTGGVFLGDEPDLQRTAQAMHEGGMREGLQAEQSVHTSLVRRKG